MRGRLKHQYNGSLGLNGHRDRIEHGDEKEPPHLHSLPSRGPASIAEHPAFDARVCGDCRLAECECRCPTCGVQSYRECEVCREAHRLTVEREQRESIEQVAWMCAQQAMEAI